MYVNFFSSSGIGTGRVKNLIISNFENSDGFNDTICITVCMDLLWWFQIPVHDRDTMQILHSFCTLQRPAHYVCK